MSSNRRFFFFLGAQKGHVLILKVGSQLLFRNGLLLLFLGGGFNILGIFSFEDGNCVSSISFEFSLLRCLYDWIFGWNGLRNDFFGEMGWSFRCFLLDFFILLKFPRWVVNSFLFFLFNLVLKELLFPVESEEAFLLVLEHKNNEKSLILIASRLVRLHIVGLWVVRIIAVGFSEAIVDSGHIFATQIDAEQRIDQWKHETEKGKKDDNHNCPLVDD